MDDKCNIVVVGHNLCVELEQKISRINRTNADLEQKFLSIEDILPKGKTKSERRKELNEKRYGPKWKR